MAHGDAREGKWRGNWRMEWVASTLYTTSEHGLSTITTADAHNSAASSRLNWRPFPLPLCRFKWTRPFRRKTKSDLCVCAITFQLAATMINLVTRFASARMVAILTRKCQKCFSLRTLSDLLNIFLCLHFEPFPLRMTQPAHIPCLISCSSQPCNGVDCYSVGK